MLYQLFKYFKINKKLIIRYLAEIIINNRKLNNKYTNRKYKHTPNRKRMLAALYAVIITASLFPPRSSHNFKLGSIHSILLTPLKYVCACSVKRFKVICKSNRDTRMFCNSCVSEPICLNIVIL